MIRKKKITILFLTLIIVLNSFLFSNIFINESNNESLHTKNFNSMDLRPSNTQINITSPENKTYSEPMSGYYPATYGFENDEIGSNPTGWVTDESGAQIEIIGEIDQHKQVVRLDEGAEAEGWDGIYHYPSTPLTNGTIEFYWRFGILENEVFCSSRDEVGGTQGIVFGVFTDYDWRYYDSGSYYDIPNVGTPLANHWYRIRIDFRCPGAPEYLGLSEGSYNATIDGINSGELSFSDETGSTDLYSFWLGTGDDCANAIVYYDAVGFSWDSDYAIGDNLNEGLLFSYDIGFTPDWQGYSLDGQANHTILGNTTFPFPVKDGIHTIQVFGNDSGGVMYESKIRYFTTLYHPKITINSPTHFEFFGYTAPNFDISIIIMNLHSRWYTLDSGATNITFGGFTGQINQTEWDKYENGSVIIRFYANDTRGLEGYSEVIVRKDTLTPSSSINFTPHSGNKIVNKSTTFSLTANDGLGSGVSYIRYKINNSNWITYTTPFTLSNYPYGDILISYQAIDNVGNIEDEHSIMVTLITEPSQPGIPGYHLFIMLSVIGIISAVIIKKKFK